MTTATALRVPKSPPGSARIGSADARWARWWNIQIKVNPTKVYDQMGRPVECMDDVICGWFF